MQRSARAVVAAFVCLSTWGCSGGAQNPELTESTEEPMSGGTVDNEDLAVGLLFSHTGTHVNESCTGTLIAPNVVLTAGHCFDTNIMDAFYVGQGVAVQSGDTDWEKATVNMRRITIDQWARPTDYRMGSGCPPTVLDVAVAHLAESVTNVAPVGITSAPPPNNSTIRTIGFGRHPTSTGPDQTCIQGCNGDCNCQKNMCGCKNTQPIIQNICICQDMGAYDQLVKRTAMVTVAESLATTLHQTTVMDSVNLPGDSGGPAIYNGVIVGTDSCGHGPANAQTDQYWARADLARDFINGKLRDYGVDGGAVGAGGAGGRGGTGGTTGATTGSGGAGTSGTTTGGTMTGGTTTSGTTTSVTTGGSTTSGATTGGVTTGNGMTVTTGGFTTGSVTVGAGGASATSTTGGAGTKPMPPPDDTGGCSCTVKASDRGSLRALAPLLVGLVLYRRRRRAAA